MTYEFAGTEDRKPDGEIISLIFKNAAQDELKITPFDFFLARYDQELISYGTRWAASLALLEKGPYPSDVLAGLPGLNR